MVGASQRTARALALTACALSLSSCVANGVCSSDDDCGEGARCDVAYGLCQQTCTDDAQCPSGACHDGVCGDVIAEIDGGPLPLPDAGPDALSVQVSSSPQIVAAGDEVKLEWSASSSAISCRASAQTVFDDEPSVLPDVSTEGTGSAFVPVEQDTTFRVSCSDAAGDIRFDDTTVDVEVAGTLSASTDALNAGQSVTLSWVTFGASTCALHDADSDALVFAVPPSDVPGGTYTFAPTSTRYLLRCDGVDLPPINLSLASLSPVTALPAAIGPTPEQVTLSWSYVGPPSCSVRVGGEVREDEVPGPSAPGHQLTLSGSADIVVSCTGHDAVLTKTLTVPRLIESFTAVETGSESAPPLGYGQGATLTWQPAAQATCELNGEPQSVQQHVVAALTTSTPYTLVCSDASGRSASATLQVTVLPEKPVLSGEIVPLLDGDGLVTGGALVLTAATSDNARACQVEAAGGAISSLPSQGGSAPARVFTGTPAPGDGVVVYRASCSSDDAGALALESDETVTVFYGEVDSEAGVLTDVGGADLLVGDIVIGPDSALTSLAALGSLRQVSGFVWLSANNNAGFNDLDGLRIERVIGDIEMRSNANLLDVGKDHVSDENLDQGFAWLEEVYGDIWIGSNPSLHSLVLPRLRTVGGSFKVDDNGALEKVSLPALTTIKGRLSLLLTPALSVGATPEHGFDALTSVGQGLAVEGTALSSVDDYFPLLSQHGSGTFSVRDNGSLPCADVVELFCRLSPRPAFDVEDNSGSCGWSAAPTCN